MFCVDEGCSAIFRKKARTPLLLALITVAATTLDYGSAKPLKQTPLNDQPINVKKDGEMANETNGVLRITHDLSTPVLPENKEEITSISNANINDYEDYYQSSNDTESKPGKTEGVQPQTTEHDLIASYSITTQVISTETPDSQDSTGGSVADVPQASSELKNETSSTESTNHTNSDYDTIISQNVTMVQGNTTLSNSTNHTNSDYDTIISQNVTTVQGNTTLSNETTSDMEEETADDEEETDFPDYTFLTTTPDYEEDQLEDNISTEEDTDEKETPATVSTSTTVKTNLKQPKLRSHATSKINHFSIVCSITMLMSLYTI